MGNQRGLVSSVFSPAETGSFWYLDNLHPYQSNGNVVLEMSVSAPGMFCICFAACPVCEVFIGSKSRGL